MKKKKGSHEEVIKCLEIAIRKIKKRFYEKYKDMNYEELKELKKIYTTVVGLLQIEKSELEKLTKASP